MAISDFKPTVLDKKLTFDTDEAAGFLKVHPNTVLQLAEHGDLPGAKIGRAWVFLVEDLVTYLREQVYEQSQQRRDGRGRRCRSVGGRGGKRLLPPKLPQVGDSTNN